jgi:hypothetical protein
LSKYYTVDECTLKKINKKDKYWRGFLTRVITLVQYLPEHFLEFRGNSARLYEIGSGKSLGLTEMLTKFDRTMQEHVRLITSEEIHDHFLI